MAIDDVFRLGDGRTVFVGVITGGPPFITRSEWDLLMDAAAVQTVTVEGEMLPEKRTPSTLRSLATQDVVQLTRRQVHTQDCSLRLVRASARAPSR